MHSTCDTIVIPFLNKTLCLLLKPKPNPVSLVRFPPLPQKGRTPLMCASENEHVNVVEKLLAAGANPDHQDEVRNLVTTNSCVKCICS